MLLFALWLILLIVLLGLFAVVAVCVVVALDNVLTQHSSVMAMPALRLGIDFPWRLQVFEIDFALILLRYELGSD